ncbi:MAG: cadherin-like domain-containing protein [Chloroflexi bacterium]|nr:cadherin-like domain-containing protein [Chloroflexota bacterium]
MNLIIKSVNDAPVAHDEQVAFTEDDVARDITAQLLTNDEDKETAVLSIVAVLTATPERIIFSEGLGTIRYDPGHAFDYLAAGETATDSFQYTIQDEEGERATATVTVQIQGRNDAPVAQNDGVSNSQGVFVVDEDSLSDALTSSLLSNDSDLDATHQPLLTIYAVNNDGTGGNVNLTNGQWRYDPGGAYETLTENETAVDTFSYSIIDPDGVISNQATVQMTILGVNDAPNLAISNLTSPIVFSPTVATTATVKIASIVEIEDVDSDNLTQVIIQFAGNYARPDGQDEFIQLTFQGNIYSSTDNFIIVQSLSDPIESYAAALQSTVYANTKTQPTAGCRQIVFQVFDEFGELSNIETIYIQVGNSVCPVSGQSTSPLLVTSLNAVALEFAKKRMFKRPTTPSFTSTPPYQINPVISMFDSARTARCRRRWV